MVYAVVLHPTVVAFLQKLPRPVSERIKAKLCDLREEPFRYLERLKGVAGYKLRIGDYRALVDIDEAARVIYIQVLDHRGRIYKR